VQRWQEQLAAQDGVLARHQALAGGMSPKEWRWRLSSGRWQRLAPGVVVAHTGAPSARELAWAACLYAGPQAALSGDGALRARGLTGPLRTTFDVVVPAAQRVLPFTVGGRTPVVVHRCGVLSARRQSLRGLPTVDAHLATLHAAAWAPDDRAAEWRVAACVQQRLTAVPLLRKALRELPRLRRRGLVAVVLDDVELGAHAGSELAFLRFCRSHGLPLPDELQVRVRAGGTRYLDARYRRQRVTVELDGAHHRDAAQWEADALRSLHLAVALPGERIVRLTPGMLRHQGPEVARLLRALLV
jgi:hypothetical protein